MTLKPPIAKSTARARRNTELEMRPALVFTIFFAVAVLASSASAGVPETLAYSGFLTEGGVPAETASAMGFELFAEEEGGEPVWTEVHDVVDVARGMFTVELGGTTSLQPVLDGAVYYLQVTIDGEAMLPRTPIVSVPYALRAGDAETLAGQTVAEIRGGLAGWASAVGFDNSASGLVSSDVQAAIDELAAQVEVLEDQVDSMRGLIEENAGAIADNLALVTSTGSTITSNSSRLDVVEVVTDLMSLDGDDLYFTGVNVNIVSGTGSTSGAVNGTGNLIVGYDEAPGGDDSGKTGSHNLIVGPNHSYPSYGGFLAGYQNSTNGAYGSVCGGSFNVASGGSSSVSGGGYNTAVGNGTSVSGGKSNTADGEMSSVSGGLNNRTAAGSYFTWVGGGHNNTAQGGNVSSPGGSVSGGKSNNASGLASSISGGYQNIAAHDQSVVHGGRQNEARGPLTAVSGGFQNIAVGDAASVSGGQGNSAVGNYSLVSGGNQLSASGDHAWAHP